MQELTVLPCCLLNIFKLDRSNRMYTNLEDKHKLVQKGKLAIITDIQKFTVHDGPGIRTMAFFKGCPLKCKWCHNPETWEMEPELMHNPEICIDCKRCAAVCKNGAISVTVKGIELDRKKCDRCGECTKTCYSGALRMAGQYMTVEEVFEKLMDDEPFYRRSNGGITLSGGECTLYAEFVIKLLKKLKEHHIHTAIETCGYCSWDKFEKILRYVDLVLFDIKVPDDDKCRFYTGQSNALIFENLKKIREINKEVVLRFPMIPGVNDDENSLRMVAEIAIKNHIKRLNIMPFHQLGSSKWKAIGRPYMFENLEPPKDKDIKYAMDLFLSYGLDASVGGSKA